MAQKRHFLSQMVYQTEILPSAAHTGSVQKIITAMRMLTVLATKKLVNLMFPQRVQGKNNFTKNFDIVVVIEWSKNHFCPKLDNFLPQP